MHGAALELAAATIADERGAWHYCINYAGLNALACGSAVAMVA